MQQLHQLVKKRLLGEMGGFAYICTTCEAAVQVSFEIQASFLIFYNFVVVFREGNQCCVT